jgi:formylglycine-generating enzyme required for sulfatase activity
LKPQNILIDARDMPRVADFGLARVEGDTVLSKSGDIAGTYHYMSPEQVSGARSLVDARTDIFSLGVVLYELLTLQRPFSGDTSQQVTAQVTSFDPPEPSVLRTQCPRDLSVITLKALQKRPAARYASMKDFADDLGRFLRHEPIHAKPASRLESVRKWVQRNPAPSVGMGVGAAALVAISGLALYAVHQAEQRQLEAERAERGESAAKDNLELAKRNAADASRRADDVLALSAQKDLDELFAEADKLWPAHPNLIPAYERWLQRARELVNGRAADEARGLKRRPSLAERKATLAELRRDARPEDEATIQAKRESLPQYAELQTKRAALRWSARMLGLEEWPSETDEEARLAQESLPSGADELNALAWPLVDPANPVLGEEVRAVLIARRAVAAASDAKRPALQDTLAWALFRAGRLDEALAEERSALAGPGGEWLRDSAAALERAVARWREDALANQRAAHDVEAEEIEVLAQRIDELRSYEFDDPDKEWWNRQLSRLVRELEELSDPKTGLMNDVLAEPFGWGIAKRLAFAKTLAELSIDGPEARVRWSEASESIRSSPKYGGLELAPQLGLLPLGMDPDSGLWEFAHLQTGAPAVRGADGRLVLNEEVGLVFVLIPGGKFWMGAQARNLRGLNHDPRAERDEGPVHEVELRAFFLSKHEMTQAQWQRIAKVNPSRYQPPSDWAPSTLHPVESVNWQECFELLRRIGLSLPSEAQWECGARGGTTTAWWTGEQRESLRGKVNIADQAAKRSGAPWPDVNDWPDLDDGSVMHCAIGSHPANGFGLHEIADNVSEWCLDEYDPAFYSKSAGLDPLSPWTQATYRVNRGGAFNVSAELARSSDRHFIAPDFRNADLGVRPARSLELSTASPAFSK